MSQTLAPCKDLEYYLNLAYPVQLSHQSDDGDEYWFAEIPQLPGCMSDGVNPNEALQNLEDAKRLWIETQIKDGYEVPEPGHTHGHNGKFLLSMPKPLHQRLATQAKHEGVSLNQHIVSLLEKERRNFDLPQEYNKEQSGQIQPLIRSLMETVLEDHPGLLSRRDLRNLMDPYYCRHTLGFILGYEVWDHALLRRQEDGILGKDRRPRYYVKLYAGQYYVCSQWWKSDHYHNAKSLLRFIEKLIDGRKGQPGVAKLKEHRSAFLNYLQNPSYS